MSIRSPRGRAATTMFRTIEALPGFASLEISLVTGRTHQIRVHLSSLHHPVVGDTRYGDRSWKAMPEGPKRHALRSFHRLGLHATALAFEHPTTGQPMRFTAPLPPEFEELLSVLRGAS
jgi:23S rRNA-/tRNA-specific pseudouridylate synthase